MRKVTANRIFENIDIQEELLEIALGDWMTNKTQTKQLCGYDYKACGDNGSEFIGYSDRFKQYCRSRN